MYNSNSVIATNFGYSDICEARNQERQEFKNLNLSITQAQDHANPQIVVKLNRELLEELDWEITDRVKVLSSMDKSRFVLVKTDDEENSFKISSQGSDVQTAIYKKRGGAVKIGWRKNLSKPVAKTGTFLAKYKIADGSVYIQYPKEIFE
jgi:hypothetical protein